MTDIGATIRGICYTAQINKLDQVGLVQDYLSEKADRLVSREYAGKMIKIHVTDYTRQNSEYMCETPLGIALDSMGDEVEQ